MSAAAPVPSRNKVPHLAEGCPIPGPAKMQFSWVVGAGWFITRSLGEGWSNPHRPRVETISVIRRIGRMNAHRPRIHPRKLCLRGARCGGGGWRAPRDGGWGLSPEALAKGGLMPPPKNGNNLSNSSHRSYECPPPLLWGRGVAVVRPSGGGANTSTPLSLRRSTINVENVVVRLWQSSAICLRASARSAFLFTGSPRSARDDKGE